MFSLSRGQKMRTSKEGKKKSVNRWRMRCIQRIWRRKKMRADEEVGIGEGSEKPRGPVIL